MEAKNKRVCVCVLILNYEIFKFSKLLFSKLLCTCHHRSLEKPWVSDKRQQPKDKLAWFLLSLVCCCFLFFFFKHREGCCVLKTAARELQGALGDCPVRASCQVLRSPVGLDPLCSLLSRASVNALRYCYQDTKYFPNILTCRQGSACLHASGSASGSVSCAWGV